MSLERRPFVSAAYTRRSPALAHHADRRTFTETGV